MIWSARLMVLRRKMELRVKDISSAMGKDSQTRSRLPVRERSHAAGSSTTSWRQTETVRLYMGLPMAWQTDPAMMQNPARGKWMPMIRRAGLPMASMSGEASKRESSVPGTSSNSAKPTAMMHTATQTASLMVFFTRSGFLAPKL